MKTLSRSGRRWSAGQRLPLTGFASGASAVRAIRRNSVAGVHLLRRLSSSPTKARPGLWPPPRSSAWEATATNRRRFQKFCDRSLWRGLQMGLLAGFGRIMAKTRLHGRRFPFSGLRVAHGIRDFGGLWAKLLILWSVGSVTEIEASARVGVSERSLPTFDGFPLPP